jgi:hypothetical protein
VDQLRILQALERLVSQFLGTGISDNLVKKACGELDVEPDFMDRVQMLNYSVKPKGK